ncbi:hypothetical protein H0H93_003823 [Arthromyces matolae]|nr:hypothetical protein H0H93_003823 [Arthromyces matolae]
MGWLSSLFSTTDSRKNQAISSTHEAFSLPTSSPTFAHPHPDAFNPDTLQTPDPDSAHITTPVYTYPPQGSGAYGFLPTSAGFNSRPASASLLPTHHDQNHTPLSPRPPYPPLASTWNRIRTWLNREYPELADTLNYGILPLDLSELEMQFGFALPSVIRESYLCVDGQEAESAAGCSEGLFFGLKLLPLEDVLQEWKFWREVDEDPATGANTRLREVMQSIPPGWIRKEYSQRGWIPLIADKVGNYVGVDLNPDENGCVGQVIVFGRDFDTKVVLWRGDGPAGWAKWLASFAEDLETGEGFEIGKGEDSADSEDDLGYEGYFYDGTGRGQGDGGGDTGNTGLRLTGEYRGWNEPEPEIVDIRYESSVEVGIPILADIETPIPAPTTTPPVGQPSNPAPLPTISVTRPPAPRPVDLPLPTDIIPVTPTSSTNSSFDEDLESGRSAGMREVSHLVPSPRTSPREDENAISNTTTQPSSTPTSISPEANLRFGQSSKNQPDVADLLNDDSAPSLETKPIIPSSPSPSTNASQTPLQPMEELSLEDENALPVPTPSDPSKEDTNDPTTTIRLVGGGGVVGLVEPEEDVQEETPDVASDAATSEPASATTTNGSKTHKKTKSSLAGLKKLGLGRKRDSGSEHPVAT